MRFLGEGGGGVRPPDPRGGEGVVQGVGAGQGAKARSGVQNTKKCNFCPLPLRLRGEFGRAASQVGAPGVSPHGTRRGAPRLHSSGSYWGKSGKHTLF